MRSNLDNFAASFDAYSLERGLEAVDEIIMDNRCYQTFSDIFCHSFSQ